MVKSDEEKLREAEEKRKNDLIARQKAEDKESRRRYLVHRRTQSIILGMDDKIHSFFRLPGTESKLRESSKSKRGESKEERQSSKPKTLINVELKIDDVEDSEEELDSSLVSKTKSKEQSTEKSEKSEPKEKISRLKIEQ